MYQWGNKYMRIVISKHGDISTIVGYIFDALDNMKMIQNSLTDQIWSICLCSQVQTIEFFKHDKSTNSDGKEMAVTACSCCMLLHPWRILDTPEKWMAKRYVYPLEWIFSKSLIIFVFFPPLPWILTYSKCHFFINVPFISRFQPSSRRIGPSALQRGPPPGKRPGRKTPSLCALGK